MAFLEELRNSMGGGSPTKGAAKSVDPNDTTNLGLGGLPSFLGTREDAAVGKRGDAQIAATLTDSLPGYFNPETRDYVPWYVDLFDGGGINRSAGMLDAGSNAQGQAVGGVMSPMRPTARPEGLLTSDMPNTGMTGIPGYTLPQSDMPNTGMTGIPGYTLPQAPASLTPDPPVVRDKWSGRMFVDERGKPFDTELWQPEPNQPGRFRDEDYQRPPQNPTIAMPQEPTVPSLPNMATPAPRNSTLGTLRENVYSVGPIEAYRNALNNRPDIPLTQPYAGGDDTPRLSEMQSPMMQHPAFPRFVELMKRTGNESSLQNPDLAQKVFNNYLRLEGL